LDETNIMRFVQAYQTVSPLTIGELWALAITLQIVMVENLRRLAERMVFSSAARKEADGLANRLLGAAGAPPESVSAVFGGHNSGVLAEAFAVQLIYRLRDQDPRVIPALVWLDERLAAQGKTADEAVHHEHHRQATASVTVRNIITSMRLISNVDWRDLFERISLVDETLAAGNGFSDMDFTTRNFYRNAIEELARGSNWTEIEMRRAHERYIDVFGKAAPGHGAAGWQMNAHALRLTQRLGYRWASDCRGTHAFVPVWNGEIVTCPQLPTTLPTLDELVGTDDLTPDNVHLHLLRLTAAENRDHVFTLHAELEGLKFGDTLERLLTGWREQDYELVSLGKMRDALDPATLPRHEIIRGEIPGRAGRLMLQGEEFLSTWKEAA